MIVGAVDIGGTKIALGLVDETGRILARQEFPTAPERGPQAGVERMVAGLGRLAAGVGTRLTAIGIGCTGPVDPATGLLGPNEFLTGWEGLNLIEVFSGAFSARVGVENDADAAALAEARWGAGKGRKRFVYITISTGIGGGILLDGRLYRGVEGAHPEVGHHTLDPSGPACSCGARGCWESLASGPAMAAWFKDQSANLASLPGNLDAGKVCQLAREGNLLALRAVQREAYYLGLGIANLITFFTPETIALGGGVMQSWPLFEPGARRVIRQTCGMVPHEKTEVILASLGADTVLVGAACVGFDLA